MKTTTAHALAIAAVLSAMSGCQTPQGWAWWKSDAAPTDTSVVARSADATQLPSAQTSPPVTVPGLQPAASPSTANLAAAGAPSAPGITIPATSPSTLTNAPLANYSATEDAANKLTASRSATPVPSYGATASLPLAGSATPTITPGATSQMAPQGVSPSGPYDPSSYRPSAVMATAAPASNGRTTATPNHYQVSGDRYGITPIGSGPVATEQQPRAAENLPAAPPASNAITGDRYGVTVPDRTIAPQTSAVASQPPSGVPSPATTTPISSAPSTAPSTVAGLTAPTPAPAATASAQATTPAGHYRPGGTTSYIGSLSTQHMEVATRPAPPATVAPATQSASPAGNSVPWTPSTTPPAAASGTQRY